MVTVEGRRVAASSWTHWGLRQYVNQGTFEDAVAKMFWVSLVAKFQILIVSYFVGNFNSLFHAGTFSFGERR
jgi:hypothetical protein